YANEEMSFHGTLLQFQRIFGRLSPCGAENASILLFPQAEALCLSSTWAADALAMDQANRFGAVGRSVL
ncbi:MAG: hypothetical protein ACLPIC_02840, partial [Rhodoblastus sp.]|uniref:hypothetical protein n=1 Tax=Rhodoblastus sp. TaxID=1962975 RepID=UPI003F99754B